MGGVKKKKHLVRGHVVTCRLNDKNKAFVDSMVSDMKKDNVKRVTKSKVVEICVSKVREYMEKMRPPAPAAESVEDELGL